MDWSTWGGVLIFAVAIGVIAVWATRPSLKSLAGSANGRLPRRTEGRELRQVARYAVIVLIILCVVILTLGDFAPESSDFQR